MKSLVLSLVFAALYGGITTVARAETVEKLGGATRVVPLTLKDVELSLERHHPLIEAALERKKRAQGNLESAQGSFDPKLKAQGKLTTGGYYDLARADIELRQNTGIWGTELFGGYRVGKNFAGGSFPTYYEDQTLDGGEVRVGFEAPLYRGGPIDGVRAKVAQAESYTRAAEHGQQRQSFETRLLASKAYFRWVAAGHKMRVAEQSLALARARGEQMSARTELGAGSEFDRMDNDRMVIEREERLLLARREFEAASFELGLYLRSPTGETVVPEPHQLPSLERSTRDRKETVSSSLLAHLHSCHPALRAMRADLEALETEVKLARNQLAPELTAVGQISRDIGDATLNPALAGTVFELGVKLSMPLFLRPERGQLEAKSAALREKSAEIRFLEDRVRIALSDLSSRIAAAEERVARTLALHETSRSLVQGEREKFEMGNSNLMFVNLRELALADADARVVDALQQNHEALYELKLLEAVTCENSPPLRRGKDASSSPP